MATRAPRYYPAGKVYHIRSDCSHWEHASQRGSGMAGSRRICLECLQLLIQELAEVESYN